MASNTEIIFGFLRNMLYEPHKAYMNLNELDKEHRKLAEGLLYVNQQMQEQRTFVGALAKGDLTVEPPRNNELVASLKSLQASLKHLTWQTQQVASGDYGQRVDFMGEFSDAFNQMIQQLDARQQALEEEIERGREKSRALEASNVLLTNITCGISKSIVVLNDQTGNVLFMNPAAEQLLAYERNLLSLLNKETQEVSVAVSNGAKFYAVENYAVRWADEEATAFILDNISEKKKQIMELEHFALYDELTGVKNRFAGMNILQEWIDKKKRFVLAFIDLDNLKYVNDGLGHKEGDCYIIRVSQLLLSFSKDVIVSRIGGDEFMVLILNQDKERADRRFAELNEEMIRSTADAGHVYKGSISYGTVEYDQKMSASEMLGLADGRMYECKREHKWEIMGRK